MDTDKANRFLQDLELATLEVALPADISLSAPQSDDNARSAAVVAGSTVSFVAGVKAASRNAALKTTLIAQLGASKHADRQKDLEAWYDKYTEILMYCGWVVQDFSFDEFQSSGDTVTIDEMVAAVLAAVVTGNELLVAQQAIGALKALSKEDARFVLFDQTSHSMNKGNFQIAAASEKEGAMAMALGAFTFSSRQNVTHLLWYTFSSSQTKFFKSAQIVTLDMDHYNRVRKTIEEQTAEAAKKYLGELKLT